MIAVLGILLQYCRGAVRGYLRVSHSYLLEEEDCDSARNGLDVVCEKQEVERFRSDLTLEFDLRVGAIAEV